MFYQYNHSTAADYFIKECGENFSFPVHLHNSFELITVCSGAMDVTIDADTYTLNYGDSVLVFPNQIHSLQSTESKHVLCIFSAELVKAYYTLINNKVPVNNKFTLSKYLTDELRKLTLNSSVIEKKAALYSLCAHFDTYATYQNKDKLYDGILNKIFEFVEQNYTGQCSLEALSKQTGYSYSYLSRCFSKSTGISYNAYVNQYRIRNACHLMNNTDYSILRCALESGYTSLRSFNRNFFSLLNTTPGEYRDKNIID